jgi:hypothetical protein
MNGPIPSPIKLIVEEVALSERTIRINKRGSCYLRGGADWVWILIPHEEAIIAYGRRGELQVIEAGEDLPTLDGAPALPLRAGDLL